MLPPDTYPRADRVRVSVRQDHCPALGDVSRESLAQSPRKANFGCRTEREGGSHNQFSPTLEDKL